MQLEGWRRAFVCGASALWGGYRRGPVTQRRATTLAARAELTRVKYATAP
jgi:hypothetical protein